MTSRMLLRLDSSPANKLHLRWKIRSLTVALATLTVANSRASRPHSTRCAMQQRCTGQAWQSSWLRGTPSRICATSPARIVAGGRNMMRQTAFWTVAVVKLALARYMWIDGRNRTGEMSRELIYASKEWKGHSDHPHHSIIFISIYNIVFVIV